MESRDSRDAGAQRQLQIYALLIFSQVVLSPRVNRGKVQCNSSLSPPPPPPIYHPFWTNLSGQCSSKYILSAVNEKKKKEKREKKKNNPVILPPPPHGTYPSRQLFPPLSLSRARFPSLLIVPGCIVAFPAASDGPCASARIDWLAPRVHGSLANKEQEKKNKKTNSKFETCRNKAVGSKATHVPYRGQIAKRKIAYVGNSTHLRTRTGGAF
ncbi:hypothetical protein BX600DRAFT_472486 [Xylariales sp. PMI_506]|nr:hypothetical protein BX600DRAFT_472486 [Xylariales sp. PMI_506]